MDPLEVAKLRHQAISEVVQSQNKEQQVDQNDANTLLDFDDADGGMDEWANTDEYAKYMDQVVAAADRPKTKPLVKKPEAQVKAEKKQAEFESDVEQVQAMYEMSDGDDFELPQTKAETAEEVEIEDAGPTARDSFYEELWAR